VSVENGELGRRITITTAVEDDIPWIIEVEREAISPPWTHGALLGEIYRDDSYFAVASGNGEKLGFIIMRCMLDCGELLQIAVDKAKRRRGVADLLMCFVLNHARQNSLSSVFLEVRKSNAAAISLYKKHGYSLVRSRKDYYTDPVEDALVMSVLVR